MKKTILFISILFMAEIIIAQDFSKQVDNNNEFCFDFYSYLNVNNENLFISPFSVSTALAMTYEGAKEKTRKEMSEIMHFPLDNKMINKDFQDIISRTQQSKDTKHYTFNIANSIWAQKDFDFLQSYFNTIKTYYDAPIESVDFKDEGNRENTRKRINTWTAKKTNDKIKDLLDISALDYDTKMVLVNAVYFLAQWNKTFNEKNTKKDTFYSVNGKTEKDFMHLYSRMNYAKSDSVQILEIPYKDKKASMIIILPDSSDQFANLQKTINCSYYNDLLKKAEFKNISLSLPKFKIEYKEDLAKILYDAGMKTAFTDKADFSGMVCIDKESVKIDKIIHQTFINIDESGTEAAAATAVVMKRVTSVNPDDKIEFKADPPFIFLIKENSTNSILFMGHLMN